MRPIKRILIHQQTGDLFLIKDLEESFHTQYGVISNFKRGEIESSKGDKFACIEPQFADLWKNLKRGPAMLLQKDLGLILAKTGVNEDFRVVDAGGGSGSLCLSLANVCKEITVYENNPEHLDVVQRNMQLFGLQNLVLKQENIYQGIKEKELDLITLDLPEPWQVTEHAIQALKLGGHLVVYLPNLNQVKQFLDSTKGNGILVTDVLELMERKWKITEKIMRPEFEMLGHTGFLIFCRKIR